MDGSQKGFYDFTKVRQAPPGGRMDSRGGRLATGMNAAGGVNRPVTSNTGAKFSNKLMDKKGEMHVTGEISDKLRATQNQLSIKQEVTSDMRIKKNEQEINKLINETALALSKNSLSEALEKAKDAILKEKQLSKYLENNSLDDQSNLDLHFAVTINLASAYEANGMTSEALKEYTNLITARTYPRAGSLRVNMGNIYFNDGKYPMAIKMYKMALDLVPKASKNLRSKIMKNIGAAQIKNNNIQDAITTYESIMENGGDHENAFNLMLCLYALGDREKMKRAYVKMLNIDMIVDDEVNDDDDEEALKNLTRPDDPLKSYIKEARATANKYLLDASKLIAGVIEDDIVVGYEWIIEVLGSSSHPEIQSEIEILKALALVKKKNVEGAIETLKAFEKKDRVMMAKASTNLSFLHFLENDFKNAEKYAEMAISYDRYHAKALVNRGNCLFMKNDFLRAKDQYLEAIGVEADCVEALYNLAFVNKRMNLFVEALQALEKLQTIVSNCPEVLYQIANLHQMMGNNKHALKWYQILLTQIPNDPNVLATMGKLSHMENEESQAFHYYHDAYKLLPTNIDTLSWLGVYYSRSDMYEKAVTFFDRASQVEPKDVRWRLMVASCWRRIGSFQKALKLYEDINAKHPDNLECLKFLVQIRKEMGLSYDEYNQQLRRLEREFELEQARYDNDPSELMNMMGSNEDQDDGGAAFMSGAPATRNRGGMMNQNEVARPAPGFSKPPAAMNGTNRDDDVWNDDAEALP